MIRLGIDLTSSFVKAIPEVIETFSELGYFSKEIAEIPLYKLI